MPKERRLGSHYTYPDLALEHTRNALAVHYLGGSRGVPHIIDLACGDGALLRAMAELCVDPYTCAGIDLDPEAVPAARARNSAWDIREGDALFDPLPERDNGDRWDIALCNPPWVGKVSEVMGSEYAKKVAKAYGPKYNAASDICAAFVLRAAQVANQLSFICTNTAWQGRTYRSGVKRLLMSGEWSAVWLHEPEITYNGLGVTPRSRCWEAGAAVHFITFHLIRVSAPAHSWAEGGMHYANWEG